jgi:hypothetical protein
VVDVLYSAVEERWRFYSLENTTVMYMLHVDEKRVVVMGVGSHWLGKKALWVSRPAANVGKSAETNLVTSE